MTTRDSNGSGPGQRATIEVRIRELGQLFNSLNPSPFTERDLDDDAEAYIVGWAHEVDTKGPFQIIVHLLDVLRHKRRASTACNLRSAIILTIGPA